MPPRGRITRPKKASTGEVSAAPLYNRGFVNIGRQGTTAQYVWLVKNIGGPVELVTANATQAVGIPQRGDWHRVLNIPVSNVRAELVEKSTTAAYVTVDYGLVVEGGGGWFDNEPSESVDAQWEVTSTVQSTTTNMDVDGNQIVLEVEVPDPEGESGDTIWKPQGGEVSYQQPMSMVIGRRRENFSPGVDVPGGRLRSLMYVGRTNKTLWFGDVAGMWLCTKMNGVSDDAGVTWNVTYEFQRREPDWTAFVIARDPVTGEPVALTDVNRGRSSKTVVLYGEAEFHQLRLYTA